MEAKVQNVNGFLEGILNGVYGNSVSDILSKHGYDKKQVLQVESDINDMLSKITLNLQSLKKSGKSREAWLTERLGQLITEYKIKDPHTFIRGISQSLPESDLRFELQEDDSKSTNHFDNYLSVVANSVVKSSSVSIARDFQFLDTKLIQEGSSETEIPFIRKMLENPLGNPAEKEAKQLLSAGMLIIKNHSDNPAFKGVTNSQIVASVDKGVDNIVFAAHVASGDIDLFDALEEIYDRNIVRACTIVEKTCEEFGANVGRAGGEALGSWIGGPVAGLICGKIGEVIGRYGGKLIGKLVSKGVKFIADCAKGIARTVYDGVVSTAESVIDFIFGF